MDLYCDTEGKSMSYQFIFLLLLVFIPAIAQADVPEIGQPRAMLDVPI